MVSNKKAFLINTITNYIFRIVNIICAFIIPRIIIIKFGSEVNGLVSSITQFLTIIALSDMGVGTVVLASLYKPIEDKNFDEISKIMTSAQKFYRNIGRGLVIYTVLLCVAFPAIIHVPFDSIYVVGLIIIMSLSSFAQYFFGIVSKQFLTAQKKRYVISITDSIMMAANTVACVILARMGFGIHTMKMCTTFFYVAGPLFYHIYVCKNYKINWNAFYKEEPIKQKWEGLAQHISYFVFTNTDIIVLTFFCGVKQVSVYSVYALVLKGIGLGLNAFESAIQPIFGADFARNAKAKFRQKFLAYQLFIMCMGTVLYGCTNVLMIPFVKIYTRGISDTEYILPTFATLITTAFLIDNWASLCKMIVNVTGSFKETKKTFVLTAAINVAVSVLLTFIIGINGVAIGTLIAAVYQFALLGHYVYKKLIDEEIHIFAKITIANFIVYLVGVLLCSFIHIKTYNYFIWFLYAIIIFALWLVLMAIMLVLGRKTFEEQIGYVKGIFFRK